MRSRFHQSLASDIELEVHHVAVAHDVLLALEPKLPGFATPRFPAERDEVLPPDDLGLDEAALEVAVDDPRRLRRLHPRRDGPCAHFLLARGEVAREPQEPVPGLDEPIEARRRHPEARKELL